MQSKRYTIRKLSGNTSQQVRNLAGFVVEKEIEILYQRLEVETGELAYLLVLFVSLLCWTSITHLTAVNPEILIALILSSRSFSCSIVTRI